MKICKLFTFILLILLLTKSVFASPHAPKAVDGILDLRDYDIHEEGYLPLNGEWEFFWQEYIDPRVTDSIFGKGIRAKVPSVWNNYELFGAKLPGRGFASYKLKVLLDKAPKEDLSLKLLAINTCYSLYINGEKVSSSGHAGVDANHSRPAYDPKVVTFQGDSSTYEFVFHVANFSLYRGGFREKVLFGTAAQLREVRERNIAFELLVFGAIIIIGFQYLVIYLTRRKDIVHLYFFLICISVGFRMLVLNERYLLHLLTWLPFKIMLVFALGLILLATLFFVLYIRELFREHFPKYITRFIIPIISVQVLIIIFGNTIIGSRMVVYMQVTAMLCLMLVIYVVTKAVIAKKQGAKIILAGSIIVTMASINDILYDKSLSPVMNILPAGLFLFLFSQSILLSRRNSSFQRNIEKLSGEISETNVSLQRFVPREFLHHLNKESITDVHLGDQVLKRMSVLFSDVRSFTDVSEKMSPQENFNFINTYLDHIGPAISNNNGFIDKYVGDAIMALFPEKAEDSIAAAVDMQKRVQEFNKFHSRRNFDPISVGIGIHTGNLMLGTIGHVDRMETTVISDSVNLAARMENLTKLYGAGIITSRETLNQVHSNREYNFRVLDTVKVRGREKIVTIIEILDGLPLIQFTKKMESRDDFEKGIMAYQSGELIVAKDHFLRVLMIDKNDIAASFYTKRCDKYLEKGIEPSWDGVQIFST